jgi:lipopolysaccharide export system protein LptA
MTGRLSSCKFLALLTVTGALVACEAWAQAPKPAASAAPSAVRNATVQQGPPNALQGFSQNRNEPVQIDAQTLEVRDKDKVATFTGKVHVIQGDTDMRSETLVVFYEEDSKAGAKGTVKAAQPGPGGSSQIKRLEANGSVVVTQKEQTATGNKGIFDMRSNSVTLLGNVVISQCQNILRGERLTVDLTTGVSRVEGGRVQGLFNRNKDETCPTKETSNEPAKEAPKEAPKASPKDSPKMRGLY